MIRWIRDRLGTAPHDSATDRDYVVVDVRHLVDKDGNTISAVRELVDLGEAAYRAGRTVVIACDLGISRSNAIAAGVLARVEGLSFDAAIHHVIAATKEPEIKLDLAEAVRAAVDKIQLVVARGNVLVTGAQGVIGTGVLRRLGANFNALGPDTRELDMSDGAVTLANYCRRHEIGQIVHLDCLREHTTAAAAALSVLLLRNILDVCRLLAIRLVLVSSSTVFSGYKTTSLFADEATPIRPRGVYPEIKATEEFLVNLYAKRGDLQRSICRLTTVFGHSGLQSRFIQTFFQGLAEGKPIRTHCYRNGRPAIDLLHISDAVEAIVAVVSTMSDDVYHFGTGTLTQTDEIARTISRITHNRLIHEEIDIDDFTSNVAFPSVKARTRLGWIPRVGVEDGLKRMLEICER